MDLVIVVFATAISIITALLVYLKNPRSGTNVYLGSLIVFIGLYTMFNYLAIHSGSDAQALVWAKIILYVSIPQGPLLYSFARTFPSSRFIYSKRLQTILLIWVIFDIALATFGLIFKAVSVDGSTVRITPGPLVPFFGLLHAGSIVAGIAVLAKKYIRAVDKEKEQLTYVFFGMFISFSLTFLITFILPILLQNTLLLAISPLFLALAVVSVAYAIVSRKLFDIRYVVIRAAVYSVTRIFTTLLYVIPVILLVAEFMGVETNMSLVRFSVVVGIVFALFYDVAYHAFNSITNRFFFRRRYEPQEVLNRLSELLVTTNDAENIMSSSRQLLRDTIGTKHFDYWLVNDKNNHHVPYFDKLPAGRSQDNVMVIDDFDDAAIKRYFREIDAAVVVRLRTNKKILGYISIGYKESGEIYREADKRLLRIAADEIAISLQNALHFEEIQRFNNTLKGKVEEQTRKYRMANIKLKKLDETKDEFISMASHQLRTPLTSVKGYLSMVLEGDAGPLKPQQEELLKQSYLSSQRMVNLIADLLNLSRLNTGKFVIEAKPTDLRVIVDQEVAQLRESAKAKNISFAWDIPQTFSLVELDEGKMHQVVMNFIDNAIYYTPEGGSIVVGLTETDSSVEFRVKDSGIGIPRDVQHKLFGKFYRADNARRMRPDGTGLGLYMAKKVVIAQGGSIIFESVEGKGSTFGFRFAKM